MGLCTGGSPLPSGFEPVRCPVAIGTPKHENGGGLAGTRMRAASTARDGILVYQTTPGVIFIRKTRHAPADLIQ